MFDRVSNTPAGLDYCFLVVFEASVMSYYYIANYFVFSYIRYLLNGDIVYLAVKLSGSTFKVLMISWNKYVINA